MSNSIFINMAVKDLQKSIEYFTKVGYTFNPKFTDDTATCMRISDTNYVMLLTEEKFKSFTPKEICDTSKSLEVMLSISLDSRQEVDDAVKKVVAAGGISLEEPEDLGFMYSNATQDLDGHVWNYFHMDLKAFDKIQDEQKLETAK